MSRIWPIIILDLRRNWFVLLLWWIVLALKTAFPSWVISGALGSEDITTYQLLGLADILLLAVIVSRLISANPPVPESDREHSRAISVARIAAAKILFLGAFCWLVSLAFALATKIIYHLPREEWADSVAMFALGQAAYLTGLLVLATVFDLRFGWNSEAIELYVILTILYYIFWPLFAFSSHGEPIADLPYLTFAILAAIASLLFLRGENISEFQSGLIRVVGLLAALDFLIVAYSPGVETPDPLEQTRRLLTPFLMVVCALVFVVLRFARPRSISSRLVLTVGLVASLLVRLIWPWPLIVSAPRPPSEPRISFHSVLAEQTGLVVRATTIRQRAAFRKASGDLYQPQAEIRGELTGNITPSDPDEIWIPARVSARIVWPVDTYLKPSNVNPGIDYGGDPFGLDMSSLGHVLSTDHSSSPSLPLHFAFTMANLADFQLIQVQEYHPRWEGEIHFQVGNIKRLAELPLKQGAVTDRPFPIAITNFVADKGGKASVSTNFGPSYAAWDYPFDFESQNSSGEFLVLWNPKRQESAIGNRLHQTGTGVLGFREFNENGSSFVIHGLSVIWLFNLPLNEDGAVPKPMSLAQSNAWLADAHLVWLRYIPTGERDVSISIASLIAPPLPPPEPAVSKPTSKP